MDQNHATEKAKQFARMRYQGESQRIVLEHETRIFEMRERAAADGTLMSSGTVHETARIRASQIETLTWARLDSILEGYELYQVEVDDQMAINICDEIIQGMNNSIYSSQTPTIPGLPAGSAQLYQQFLKKYITISADLVKTKIDRRRLTTKKKQCTDNKLLRPRGKRSSECQQHGSLRERCHEIHGRVLRCHPPTDRIRGL
jgi:hypothetical protein